MNDSMNDRMDIYYESYYGTPIPASQVPRIQKRFMEMVKAIKNDIEDYLPQAEEASVKAGILEALLYLQSTGDVQSPDLYLRSPNHAKEAFRYAIAAANGKRLRRERTPQEITQSLEREKEATRKEIGKISRRDENHQKMLEERSPHSANLWNRYESIKRTFLEQGLGHEEAKVKAFTNLIDNWHPNAHIEYFIIGHSIPMKEGIFDDPDVMRYLNACPYFNMDRTGSQLELNGKPWKGIQ